MNGIDDAALVVRAAALYLPALAAVAFVLHRRPDRRRVAGAVLATAWNLPALLAVNLVAGEAGWWAFHADGATIGGVPADLWIGWAVLWGAVPILAGDQRIVLTVAVLVALDLALMPRAAPVVALGPTWLAGEATAVGVALVPALLLGRWTERDVHLPARVALQLAAFTGLLLFVLPASVFALTGESWDVLRQRSRGELVLAAVLVAPVVGMAIQALIEFAAHGGTPVPLDPPKRLVTTGPYAYVANPMQLAGTILLAVWGLVLGSAALVAASGMAVAFSAGLAAWNEDAELRQRFGDDWVAYRRAVRPWLPSRRPAIVGDAVTYAAASCAPCREVGGFLARRPLPRVALLPAEQAPVPLRRVTYIASGRSSDGIAAIVRTLEHDHLGWAVVSWMARVPGVQQVLQLIADVVGGGPRTISHSDAVPEPSGLSPSKE